MKKVNYDQNYVKFEKGQQTIFLKSVKSKSFKSWDKLADFLGVNRSMVFFYLSEKHKLPYTSVRRLCEKSKTNLNNFVFKIVPYSIYGTAKVPKEVTPDLAEFVGIMLGDGSINSKSHQVIISCGEIDGDYIKRYIPKLIQKLFSKKASFRKINVGGIDCLFASKEVCEYITEKMNFHSPKTNVEIPMFFFKDSNLLKACIRGLFDTDGGLHRHHQKSAQLGFTNKCYPLIVSLKSALGSLDYKPSITVNKRRRIYTLYLFGNEIKKYFQEIGFSNPKNQIKFKQWISTGVVPANSEIKRLI